MHPDSFWGVSPMWSEFLHAAFEMGLPVAALSWLLFYRLYSRGELARDADHKSIDTQLKAMRKVEKESEKHSDSILHAKWMKFGGGFYGVAAAWTLLYIEASGVVGVVLHPSVVMETFHNGIVHFITQQIASQITTLIDAAIWFNWWPERGHGPLMWFAVAYAGYLTGLNLARYETGFGSRVVELDSREHWLSFIPFRKKRGIAAQEGSEHAGPPSP